MICIPDCTFCIHSRKEKKDGWIPTCDAFPNGIPNDFNYGNVRKKSECGNGIGFEPNELCKKIDERRKRMNRPE